LGEAFFLGGMPPKPIYAHKRRAGGRGGRRADGRDGQSAAGGRAGRPRGSGWPAGQRAQGREQPGPDLQQREMEARERKCSRSSSAERADREHLGVYEDGTTDEGFVRGPSTSLRQMLSKLVARLAGHGLDAKATTILSDMNPASSGDKGPDMPRPLLDCGPYANSVRPATPQRAIATLAQRPARHAHGATPRKSGSPAGNRRHRGLCRIAGRRRPRATTPCRCACPPLTEALEPAEGANAQRSRGPGCAHEPGWRMRVCVCGRLDAFAS
jgi:hypothetical protein